MDNIESLRMEMERAGQAYKRALNKALRLGHGPESVAEERRVAKTAWRKHWDAVDAQKKGAA